MVFGDRNREGDRRAREDAGDRENAQDPRAGRRRSDLAGMNYEQGAAALSPGPPALDKGRTRTVGNVNVVSRTVKAYSKTESQARDLKKRTWGRIADFTGIHIDILMAFNPGVVGSPLDTPDEGAAFYEPTAREILFWQTARTLDSGITGVQVRDDPAGVAARVPKASAAFRKMVDQGRLAVVEAARDRTAGETGDAYARYSGAFYTRNPKLAASSKTTPMDGGSERRAAWGDVWKCNVLVNDALSQAGLDAPMLENRHYATAGMLYERHTDKLGGGKSRRRTFEEVGFDKARAGDIFVRYGGTGEASSHTEVITDKKDATTFHATGAHGEGAYERRYVTSQEAHDKARTELVRNHLEARGKDPDGMADEEFQRHVRDLGWDLMEAARIQQMNVSSYQFLRHKQVGK